MLRGRQLNGLHFFWPWTWVSYPGGASDKEPACRCRRDKGSVPELGGFPGGGDGTPLQYSCLENPMDRAAWRATVQGVTKSWTQLKQLSTHDLEWGTRFNHNLYIHPCTQTHIHTRSRTSMRQYLSLLWTMRAGTLYPKFHPKSKSTEMISQPPLWQKVKRN